MFDYWLGADYIRRHERQQRQHGRRTDAGRDTGLTERQRTILDVIRASVTNRGYPPEHQGDR